MSGGRDQLRQQIADVLREHSPTGASRIGVAVRVWMFECQCRAWTPDIAGHQADEVMSASVSFFAPPW